MESNFLASYEVRVAGSGSEVACQPSLVVGLNGSKEVRNGTKEAVEGTHSLEIVNVGHFGLDNEESIPKDPLSFDEACLAIQGPKHRGKKVRMIKDLGERVEARAYYFDCLQKKKKPSKNLEVCKPSSSNSPESVRISTGEVLCCDLFSNSDLHHCNKRFCGNRETKVGRIIWESCSNLGIVSKD